ncbi:MAG: hypothetical protein ACT6S0_00350 [Roseateles sp.]|uniref:Uncharacterized protein n=1 Tax=Roseateles asaccharophilus TaxID=582607 RepID=A0ABU2AG53_9BURK|nr:hypothetical protein [Roseateles asaccharophilus]MDR7336182.1 hypothetical protein [Roseateles asaccharophilus]
MISRHLTDDASTDESPALPADSAAAHLEAMAKGINDVDVIVQGLLDRIPPSKPWQRQLRAQLKEADRHIEILRLEISLGRDGVEIHDAARKLKQVLEVTNLQIVGGRADGWTRNALLVAYRSAALVCALLAP